MNPAGSPSPKERMKIDRQPMPEQDPVERSGGFEEVNLGYREEEARTEALRCLDCKKKQCIPGCPVGIDIPRFLTCIAEGDMNGAAEVLFRDNALPGITGRVCPQEEQCEQVCVRGIKGDPVAIGHLERFVADWAIDRYRPERVNVVPTGHRVAVVGSGPAGLTAAGELVRRGHEVTVFEALHAPGGVLRYGIPEFRLPNSIIRTEVDRLITAGVKIVTNVVIGRTYTIDELMEGEGFEAVFVANGAGLPVFMNIPGENLKGVYSANEFLTRVNLMGADRFPENATPVLRGESVVVIGGGNTAMDAVRTAKRLGAGNAVLVYRRSRKEMPARVEEIKHAEEEGIDLRLLCNPLRILGTEDGWVRGIECVRMELGEPDDSGRRRPMEIEGSHHEIPCDLVVEAIGTGANPLLTATSPDILLNRWGYIEVDEDGMTSKPGVFAGGDISRGAATVILAMGDGKNCARSIDRYLRNGAGSRS